METWKNLCCGQLCIPTSSEAPSKLWPASTSEPLPETVPADDPGDTGAARREQCQGQISAHGHPGSATAVLPSLWGTCGVALSQ